MCNDNSCKIRIIFVAFLNFLTKSVLSAAKWVNNIKRNIRWFTVSGIFISSLYTLRFYIFVSFLSVPSHPFHLLFLYLFFPLILFVFSSFPCFSSVRLFLIFPFASSFHPALVLFSTLFALLAVSFLLPILPFVSRTLHFFCPAYPCQY